MNRCLAEVVAERDGSLAWAEVRLPGAPRPWPDLSAGISPNSYPLMALPETAFSRLLEPDRLRLVTALKGPAP